MADWLGPARQTYYYVDDDGVLRPAAGWLLFHYEPDGDDFKDTWQDPEEDSLNTNPVVLDENGQASIFGNGIYRQRFTNADESEEVWDRVTGDLSAVEDPATIDPWLAVVQPVNFERFGDAPLSDEAIGICIFTMPVQIPADFDGSVDGYGKAWGYQVTNPTATVSVTVSRGTVGSMSLTTIGTISISTGGVWTWATSGNLPQAFDAGDFIHFKAPTIPDATWANIFWTIFCNVLES